MTPATAPVVVMLTFDRQTEERVRAERDELQSVHGGQALRSPPHLTVAILEAAALDRVDAALDDVAASMPAVPVRWQAVGFFPARDAVFRAPIVDPPLLALHARIHEALHRHGAGQPAELDLLGPGNWVPHLTLLTKLPPDRIGPAVATAGTGAGLADGAIVATTSMLLDPAARTDDEARVRRHEHGRVPTDVA